MRAASPGETRSSLVVSARERQVQRGVDIQRGSTHLGGQKGCGVMVWQGNASSLSDVCELGSLAVVVNAAAIAIACYLS